MNGVFIDSSVFLDFLEGKERAKALLEEYSGLEGCINAIVFSEVLFVTSRQKQERSPTS